MQNPTTHTHDKYFALHRYQQWNGKRFRVQTNVHAANQLTLPIPNCLVHQRNTGGVRDRSAGLLGLAQPGAVDAPDADLPDVDILLDPALLVTSVDILGIGREELDLPPTELDGVRKVVLVEGVGKQDRLHLGGGNERDRCCFAIRRWAVGPSGGSSG